MQVLAFSHMAFSSKLQPDPLELMLCRILQIALHILLVCVCVCVNVCVCVCVSMCVSVSVCVCLRMNTWKSLCDIEAITLLLSILCTHKSLSHGAAAAGRERQSS